MKDKILSIIDKISAIVVCLFVVILVSVILIGIIVSSFSINSLVGIFIILIMFSMLWVLIRDIF